MLHLLNDELLIEAYQSAVESQLEEDFIRLLSEELKRRGMNDKYTHKIQRI